MKPTGKLLSKIGWIYRCGVQIFFSFHATDLRLLYLFKYYHLLVNLMALMILFAVQGAYAFIFPFMFEVKFITEGLWVLRFRVLTMLLISFPMVLFNIFSLMIWPSFQSYSRKYDRLFSLG